MTTQTGMTDLRSILADALEVLSRCPEGIGRLRIVLEPQGILLGSDEVLVQIVDHDRNTVSLEPRKVSDITLKDVMHTTQVVATSDEVAEATTEPEYIYYEETISGHKNHSHTGAYPN